MTGKEANELIAELKRRHTESEEELRKVQQGIKNLCIPVCSP